MFAVSGSRTTWSISGGSGRPLCSSAQDARCIWSMANYRWDDSLSRSVGTIQRSLMESFTIRSTHNERHSGMTKTNPCVDLNVAYTGIGPPHSRRNRLEQQTREETAMKHTPGPWRLAEDTPN